MRGDSSEFSKVVESSLNPLGYSGVNSALKAQSGIVGEIQLNTPAMIYAKESGPRERTLLDDDLYDSTSLKAGVPGGKGYELYEQWRSLPAIGSQRSVIPVQSKSCYDAVRGSVYGN